MQRTGVTEACRLGRILVPGSGCGPLRVLDEPLSIWGGLDPETGRISDVHHPQHGLSVAGAIVALPGTRGSTAGPGALLEIMSRGHGPAGFVLLRCDHMLMIGVLAAGFAGLPTIPVARLGAGQRLTVAAAAGAWRLDTALGLLEPVRTDANDENRE